MDVSLSLQGSEVSKMVLSVKVSTEGLLTLLNGMI
jgi:hypothetical protein